MQYTVAEGHNWIFCLNAAQNKSKLITNRTTAAVSGWDHLKRPRSSTVDALCWIYHYKSVNVNQERFLLLSWHSLRGFWVIISHCPATAVILYGSVRLLSWSLAMMTLPSLVTDKQQTTPHYTTLHYSVLPSWGRQTYSQTHTHSKG